MLYLMPPAAGTPGTVVASGHSLSPTGVAVLLLLALVVDFLSVGPDSLRDRLAFLMYLTAVREGFNGSALESWTVGNLTNLINQLKAMSGGAYIAGAATTVIIGAAAGVLGIYTLGALMPTKLQSKLGRFAALQFPQAPIKRINYKLLILAVLLGMFVDLPGGAVGALLRTGVDLVVKVMSILPGLLFGAS